MSSLRIFPVLRATLGHPRVVVSLVALVVFVAPLGFLAHALVDGGGPETVRLTTAAAGSPVLTVLTSDADFGTGTHADTAASSGSLRMTGAYGTRTWKGRTFEYAGWTSGWLTPGPSFRQLVPSWNAATPPGSWIQVFVQVRDGGGQISNRKDLGRWALRDGVFQRSSSPSAQDDGVARVATDTLISDGTDLTAYRFTVRLMRLPGRSGPTLRSLTAITTTPKAVPATSASLRRTAVSLAVPAYSQMIHRGQDPEYGGGGEAWCSPTSVAMVLGYYGRLPSAADYAWVAPGVQQPWVNQVARSTYDVTYAGTGNWPFNTGYAATRVADAFVTRLDDLRMAERFTRAGIPLVLSVAFSRGQLTGAPISSTPGHLLVLVGFTASGAPIINDPAAPNNSTVRRVYDRAQFERAWLRGSGGMAYVIRDSAHPLPWRPPNVRNW